jgi:hypothetical protein
MGTPFLMLNGIAAKPTQLGLSIPSAIRFDYTESCIHEETPLTAQNTNRHRVFGAVDHKGVANLNKEAAGSFLKNNKPRYFRIIPKGEDIPEQAALRGEYSSSFIELADLDLEEALKDPEDYQMFVFFPRSGHPELMFGEATVSGESSPPPMQ